MTALRGVLTADHPVAGIVDHCSPCCHDSAADVASFLFCPGCNLWLLRCPQCRGALAASGWCERCLDIRLEWPDRIDLDIGGSCDVPLALLVASSARIELHRIVLGSGASEGAVDLHGAVVNAGGRVEALPHLAFPAHGEFALRCQAELSWPFGSRLVTVAQAPGVVRVRPTRHGQVVNISGTGNLVAGGTGAGIFGTNDGGERQGVSASRNQVKLLPRQTGTAFVSWRTRLVVPDLLEGGPSIELVQRVGQGVAMGRNRPSPAAVPGPGPAEAALRFPAHAAGSRESSQKLSRSHWRFQASGGAWCLEQLGQRPTTVCSLGAANVTLEQGQRLPLHDGSKLIVPGEAGALPLVFTLRHRDVAGMHVLRSELILTQGGRA